MKKYLTSLNGKKFTVEEVLLWTQNRQNIHFNKEFRQRLIEKQKSYMTPEAREQRRQRASAYNHTPEYKAACSAKWSDPEHKARVSAKIRATKAKQRLDPKLLQQRKEKRAATVAANIKANPNYYAEKAAKCAAARAKSKKWQDFLTKIRSKDTRWKGTAPGREELLARDPDHFKKRTAKMLATQKANGGHWKLRRKAQS
jgi:hypothetical protein